MRLIDSLALERDGLFSLSDADMRTRLPTTNQDFKLGIESKGQWLHKQYSNADFYAEKGDDEKAVLEDVPSEFGFMVRVLALHGKIRIHANRPHSVEEFCQDTQGAGSPPCTFIILYTNLNLVTDWACPQTQFICISFFIRTFYMLLLSN